MARLLQVLREDEGQALVLLGVSLLALLLMAGLGVDVGYLRYQKQQMQKAADAAALAGAAALNYGGEYLLAARSDSAANGFIDGLNGVTVAVNNPPASGPFTDNTDYVEVIVAQDQPTAFMRLAGFTKITVRGRAVAWSKGSSPGCIYALDAGGRDTYATSGPAQVNAACSILVNSANSGAYLDNGGACTVAQSIGVVGGIDQATCGTPPKTGIPRFTDPLVTLPPPAVKNCPYEPATYPRGQCTYSPTGGLKCNSGPVTLAPDTYCGGITINGGVGTANFGAGTYVLAGGGLTVHGGVDVIGTGVTFFNTLDSSRTIPYRPVVINPPGDNTRLSAPLAGPYEGILFYQDRALPFLSLTQHNVISGGRNAFFEGTLYFPSTNLDFTGGGATNSNYTIIVAYTATLSGTSEFNSNYSVLSTGTSPIHSAVLVE